MYIIHSAIVHIGDPELCHLYSAYDVGDPEVNKGSCTLCCTTFANHAQIVLHELRHRIIMCS